MNNIKNREYFLIRSKEPQINYVLNLDQNIKYNNICVTSCSIPKTYYVLNSDCSLLVNENGNIIEIPFLKGNYTVKSFKNILKILMDSRCSYSYEITYPDTNLTEDDGKYTFTVRGNSGIQPTFKINDLYLSKVMGFDKDVEYGFIDDRLKSVNVLNFQSYDEILIKSLNVKNREGLLQEIYSNADQYNSSISWSNNDLLANAKTINTLNNNTLNISIQNGDGDYIYLNGNEWSVVVCIFETSHFEDKVLDYIKMKIYMDEKKELESI
jgi:hypothetical protein